MDRYHKEVYIPIEIKEGLKEFTAHINRLKWSYTPHSTENIKNRCYDMGEILKFIKDSILDNKDIFEVYSIGCVINKVCFRIKYITCDLILVIDKNKTLITIYTNAKNDNHITLNKNLYARA